MKSISTKFNAILQPALLTVAVFVFACGSPNNQKAKVQKPAEGAHLRRLFEVAKYDPMLEENKRLAETITSADVDIMVDIKQSEGLEKIEVENVVALPLPIGDEAEISTAKVSSERPEGAVPAVSGIRRARVGSDREVEKSFDGIRINRDDREKIIDGSSEVERTLVRVSTIGQKQLDAAFSAENLPLFIRVHFLNKSDQLVSFVSRLSAKQQMIALSQEPEFTADLQCIQNCRQAIVVLNQADNKGKIGKFGIILKYERKSGKYAIQWAADPKSGKAHGSRTLETLSQARKRGAKFKKTNRESTVTPEEDDLESEARRRREERRAQKELEIFE